jgi:Squalene-hopene cyclase C-terminal domain
MTRRYQGLCASSLAVLACMGTTASLCLADEASAPDPKALQAVVAKAAAYLRTTQKPGGSFSPRMAGPGVSALVASSLIRNGVSPRDPMVARTLAYLEKQIHKDGGIYDKRLANYTTSVAIMAFHEANEDGKYNAVINNATAFLKRLQYADDPNDVKYGGTGYDAGGRPDLSNTQFFVDALLAAGVPKDDPAVKRALKFVDRCQNLPGEYNDQPFARKATPDDRGGFTYNPVNPDDNHPHRTAAGGLRSLGSMTYGGLKSFLYAGVTKDDPRVKAAVDWIRRHYTLTENPGMGQAGLFYYYHTFGKAMAALGEDPFTDAAGKKHDWRRELFDTLQKRQGADGSWRNEGDRTFGESDPNLATAFALLAINYCRPAAARERGR